MAKEVQKLLKTEDYWAVWLGLGIVLLALAVYWSGGSIKGWAVTPGKWSDPGALAADLAAHGAGYLVVFALFGVAFTIGVAVNVPLGYFLSTVVFSKFWSNISKMI